MNKKRISAWIISILLILILWQLAAAVIKAPLILPSLKLVFKNCGKLLINKNFWVNFVITLIRIFTAFIISSVLGILIGFLCGSFEFFNYFFEFPLALLRTVPVIAFILFVIYWFSSNTVPVFVCVMMSFPVMVSSVTSGFKKGSKELLEMADNFNLTSMQIFKYIKLPQVIPFIKNGLVQTFGLCWKVTVAGEVLCIPKKGLGSLLQKSQIHLETAEILAITLIMVIFSFVLEMLLKLLLAGKNEN